MIYVDTGQLKHVRYLLAQAIQGNHILFDAETLRTVFSENQAEDEIPSDEDLYSAESHIERLMLQPSLAEKRAYLEKLEPLVFRRVVRVYIRIVESELREGVRH